MLTARRLVQLLVACFVAVTPLAGTFAPARAVVGGYVEVHELGCPPGYRPDALFQDCHDNRLSGVDLIAEGPGGRYYTDTTNQEGRVVFGDFLEAGPITVAETQMTGEFVDYVVFCSRVDNRQPLDVEKHSNGRAAFIVDLPQEIVGAGTGVVCDWYNLPEPPASARLSQGELPAGTIGLDRSGWMEIFGNPTKTDGLLAFNNHFIVGFSGEIATYIIDPMPSGTSMATARGSVTALLPHDATLTQMFMPPGSVDAPSAYVAEEYQSDTLASALRDAGIDGDGSILVIFQIAWDPGTGSTPIDQTVWLVYIYAGAAPTPDASD
jgi:hypothetical protein